MSDSLQPQNCSPPGSSVHGIHQARILEWEATSFSGDFPNPGVELGSPAGQADSLPSEPPGKPKMKGTFDGESTQLGAAISFQSASAPHTAHCREISAGEDDDTSTGKEHQSPLSTEPSYMVHGAPGWSRDEVSLTVLLA